MADAQSPECPNCKRLMALIEELRAAYEKRIGRLEAKYTTRIEQLEARVRKLQAGIEALQAENARLRKDSSTSHKPPSSDIVKPPQAAPPNPIFYSAKL